MKPCSRCAREIPESATVCHHCGRPAADLLDTVLEAGDRPDEEELPIDEEDLRLLEAPEPPAPPPAVLAPAPTRAGLSQRELLAIVIGVCGTGAVTLALLVATGGPSSEASAAAAAANPAGRPAAAASSTPAARRTWSSANSDWVGSQRNAVAFELLSDNKVQVWQRKAQPILVVRCVAKRMDAFVFIESAAKMESQDDRHTIRLAFDGQPESTERWSDSDEHDALFAPDGRAFAQRLTRARTLRFGYTPHNAAAVTADFNVAGLGQLLAPVARPCGMMR